jgi:hypothetical protein
VGKIVNNEIRQWAKGSDPFAHFELN